MKTDATDSVSNGIAVLGIGTELAQIGVVATGRLVTDLFLVAHLDGILWVEIRHPVVVHENGGHAVTGGRHDVAGVGTNLTRSHLDHLVPVHRFGGSRMGGG